MTYTIIGRCKRTHQIGIGIATYSLAVGGYCPYIKTEVGVVSSQAYANPLLGLHAIRLLETGLSSGEVLKNLDGEDPYFDYRQVGIVPCQGNIAAHTGAKTRSWAGHIIGNGSVAMGNGLAGEQVVQAMATAFQETEDHDLDERLLLAIEAGRDAGGQRNTQGEHLAERSSALVVYEHEEYPLMDLRVDAHDTAVEELRRVHGEYKPYIPYYYHLRAKEPHHTPPQEEWIEQQRG